MNQKQFKNRSSQPASWSFTGAARSASKATGKAFKTVDAAAHQSPWAFVGGAALAGLVAGLATRWSRSRKSN